MSESVTAGFEGWAIVELMGHRRLAGYVKPAPMYGTELLRIDIPGEDGPEATQFYGGSSIYCLTPTTEEIALRVAASCRPEPVHSWELPKQRQIPAPTRAEDDPDFDPDDDE
jgi:hypothetical protein